MTQPPSSAAAPALAHLQNAVPLISSDDLYYSLFVEESDYLAAAESPGAGSAGSAQATPPGAPPALTFSPPSSAAPIPDPAEVPLQLPNLPVSSSSAAAQPTGQGQSKPRFERRGHTKSRRGCFACKRRRIKCAEDKPDCSQCRKTGLRCEWPTLPQILHQVIMRRLILSSPYSCPT